MSLERDPTGRYDGFLNARGWNSAASAGNGCECASGYHDSLAQFSALHGKHKMTDARLKRVNSISSEFFSG